MQTIHNVKTKEQKAAFKRTCMPVEAHCRVYRNLHNGKWSIQQKVNGKWCVVAHADYVQVFNAEFKVSEAGRQRVLKEKAKNVHAYVEGELLEWSGNTYKNRTTKGIWRSKESYNALWSKRAESVTYNPYKYDSFVNRHDESKREQSTVCVLDGKFVYAFGDSFEFFPNYDYRK